MGRGKCNHEGPCIQKVEWNQDPREQGEGFAFISYSCPIPDFDDGKDEIGLKYPPNFAAISTSGYSFRKPRKD